MTQESKALGPAIPDEFRLMLFEAYAAGYAAGKRDTEAQRQPSTLQQFDRLFYQSAFPVVKSSDVQPGDSIVVERRYRVSVRHKNVFHCDGGYTLDPQETPIVRLAFRRKTNLDGKTEVERPALWQPKPPKNNITTLHQAFEQMVNGPTPKTPPAVPNFEGMTEAQRICAAETYLYQVGIPLEERQAFMKQAVNGLMATVAPSLFEHKAEIIPSDEEEIA